MSVSNVLPVSIDLSRNKLTCSDVTYLVQQGVLEGVTALDLSGNALDSAPWSLGAVNSLHSENATLLLADMPSLPTEVQTQAQQGLVLQYINDGQAGLVKPGHMHVLMAGHGHCGKNHHKKDEPQRN